MRVFVCDYVRTPIGRYGGALSSIRTDDLAAFPISTLVERHAEIDWSRLDEVVLGCTTQTGYRAEPVTPASGAPTDNRTVT